MGKYEIGKAKLTEPIRGIKLGEKDFIYGAKLSFVYSDQSQRYRIDSYKPGNWQVKPEGIYAIGYRSDAFIENDVKDFQHLKDSYGYYLLNNDGNKHTMVEKLDFEYK